jgi:hypothetical protein
MGITSRGAGRYELWPVLAVGGSAQRKAVADERIGGRFLQERWGSRQRYGTRRVGGSGRGWSAAPSGSGHRRTVTSRYLPRRRVSPQPTLQTVPQQPDNFVPSMTIACMTLAEKDGETAGPALLHRSAQQRLVEHVCICHFSRVTPICEDPAYRQAC